MATKDLIDHRYHVLARLGSGSSGTVYKVRDQQTNTIKALKLLASALEFPHHELTALQKIKHSGVVNFFEKGSDYFTMEYIDGIPLSGHKFPIESWKPLAIDLIRALQAIHSAGWVHGDLKPSHILCPIAGGVKLLDFGLASQSGDLWMPAGTPGFIAPEVLQGQSADVRSDLYCFGVILYLITTGHMPHQGQNITEHMLNQIQFDPRPPHEHNQTISKKDSHIIMKLLERNPTNRFQSAREVISVFTDQQIETPPKELQEAPLIGRDQALERIKKIIQDAKNGQGRFVLLHGEEGVGRSRFLKALKFEAHMHNAQGSFCVIKPWLTPPYHQLIGAINHLFQKNKFPPIKEATHIDLLCQQIKGQLNDQPYVLIIDDIQEADASTFKAIDSIVNLCDDFPFIIIASWRDTLSHGSAIRHLPQACKGRHYYDIALARFEKSETFDFISHTLGQDDEIAQEITHHLHESCLGRPRYIKDAIKSLREQHTLKCLAGQWVLEGDIKIPPKLDFDHWQLTRIEKFPKLTINILQAIAITGSPTPIELISQLCDVDEKTLLPKIHELVQSGVIRNQSWGWVLNSHNLSEHLLTQLSPRQKVKLHRKIATIFQNINDPLQRALLSWNHAFHGGKMEEGLELLEQAITFLYRDHQEDSALDLCQKGIELLDDQEQISVKARLLARLGNSARRQGHWDQGADYLRQALSLETPLKQSARLHCALAHCLVETRLTEEARWRLQEVKQLDRSQELELTAELLKARCFFIDGDLAQAREKFKQCLHHGEKRRNIVQLIETLIEFGKLQRFENHLEQSTATFLKARKLAENSPGTLIEIDLELVETAIVDGRLEYAQKHLKQIEFETLIRTNQKSHYFYLKCLIHLQHGNFGLARQAYNDCLKYVPLWQMTEQRKQLFEALIDHLPIIQIAQTDWLQLELQQFDDPTNITKWKDKLNRLSRQINNDENPVQTLNKISSLLNSEKNLSRLFPLIMDQVIRVVGAERGFLMLKENHRDGLHFAAARNLDQKTIAQPSFSISASISKQVMETGQAILTRDALNDERFRHSDSIQELKLKSILCCPLKLQDELIGVVYVDNRTLSDKFNDENLNLLTAVADQAALAIDNARLAEKNHQQTLQLEKTARRLAEKGRRLEETVSRQNRELAQIKENQNPFKEILGNSQKTEQLRQVIMRCAPSSLPILIQGESGSGKELVARALHFLSDHCAGPFQAINCGTFNSGLLESELFGHQIGAFTGAIREHKGVFEQADGGTLFLDEIGEMPPTMQVKLLRVLETGEVRPIGSSYSVSVSVRIIAATNRQLEVEVSEGRFRQDLYFRLSGFILQTPPLRDRKEDIEPLFLHFLSEFAQKNQQKLPKIEPVALEALKKYSWPGNVRELKNCAERLVSLGYEIVKQKYLPNNQKTFDQWNHFDLSQYKHGRRTLLDQFDQAIVCSSLKTNRGNVSAAARAIGIERQYFHKIMKKHGVRSEDFR